MHAYLKWREADLRCGDAEAGRGPINVLLSARLSSHLYLLLSLLSKLPNSYGRQEYDIIPHRSSWRRISGLLSPIGLQQGPHQVLDLVNRPSLQTIDESLVIVGERNGFLKIQLCFQLFVKSGNYQSRIVCLFSYS